jgi:hypothetical protein
MRCRHINPNLIHQCAQQVWRIREEKKLTIHQQMQLPKLGKNAIRWPLSILLSFLVIPLGYRFVLADLSIGVFFMDCHFKYSYWSSHGGI